ncbi:hypothetical protein BU17DRAFT_101605 [Hysterangium stoloniferum]|nr:hypothetical protein BU17DRAFT_101605 [Hysterangium stoloniferum]
MDFLRTIILAHSAARPIRIYVDALDEAAETVASGVVEYFQPPTVDANLSICFSRRHYSVVTRDKDNGLKICVEEENHAGIETYVWKELEERYRHLPMDNSRCPQNHCVSSPRPNQTGDCGNGSKITTHVGCPLSGNSGETERKQSLHLMQWVCFALRPLSLGELHAVMKADADSPLLSESDGQMKKRVTSLSGGLIEVGQGNNVRFIHQSVPDYILGRGVDGEEEEKRLTRGLNALRTDLKALTVIKRQSCSLAAIEILP